MTAIRFFAPSLIALALVACSNNQNYDTPATAGAGTPSASVANTAPANPVYDTPAAYEDTSTAATTSPTVTAPVDAAPATVEPTAPPANGAATIHTVVAGDTLSGISKKYRVPVASIKQANRMTNDIVVLGRKMVIPSR